jgi:hypothetical protein
MTFLAIMEKRENTQGFGGDTTKLSIERPRRRQDNIKADLNYDKASQIRFVFRPIIVLL